MLTVSENSVMLTLKAQPHPRRVFAKWNNMLLSTTNNNNKIMCRRNCSKSICHTHRSYNSYSVAGGVVCTPWRCGKRKQVDTVFGSETQQGRALLLSVSSHSDILLKIPPQPVSTRPHPLLVCRIHSTVFGFCARQRHDTSAASALSRGLRHMRSVWLVCCRWSAETAGRCGPPAWLPSHTPN